MIFVLYVNLANPPFVRLGILSTLLAPAE